MTLLLDTGNNEQGNGVLHNQQIYRRRISVILDIYGLYMWYNDIAAFI